MAYQKRRSEAKWNSTKEYWQVNVQKDGVRKSFYSSTKGRVGKHEAENKADKWLDSRGGSTTMRFRAAWESYENHAKEATSTGNYDQIEYIGRMYIKPNVPNMYIADITPANWQRCVDTAVQKGLSRRSCKNVLGVISGFVTFCRKQRWEIDRFERGEITVPMTTHVGKRKILQPSDLKTLFKVDTYTQYNKRERTAFYIHAWRFLVLAGLRRGELCGLRWEDIDGHALNVRRSVNKYNEITGGKNDNARRCVALSARALGVLEDQKTLLKKRGMISPWVFPDEKSGGMLRSNTIYQRWSVYAKQHSLKSSLHELRHTFISAVKSDMPEPLLKAMVGHSDDMDTYGTYGHEIEGDLQQTATIVDNVFHRLIDD